MLPVDYEIAGIELASMTANIIIFYILYYMSCLRHEAILWLFWNEQSLAEYMWS